MDIEYKPENRWHSAIRELAPNCVYHSDKKVITKWLTPDIAQPSEADINAKVAEYKIKWDDQDYARKRQAEYPDMGTQLNKIYDDGLTKWKSEMVDPIKAKYPKP